MHLLLSLSSRSVSFPVLQVSDAVVTSYSRVQAEELLVQPDAYAEILHETHSGWEGAPASRSLSLFIIHVLVRTPGLCLVCRVSISLLSLLSPRSAICKDTQSFIGPVAVARDWQRGLRYRKLPLQAPGDGKRAEGDVRLGEYGW